MPHLPAVQLPSLLNWERERSAREELRRRLAEAEAKLAGSELALSPKKTSPASEVLPISLQTTPSSMATAAVGPTAAAPVPKRQQQPLPQQQQEQQEQPAVQRQVAASADDTRGRASAQAQTAQTADAMSSQSAVPVQSHNRSVLDATERVSVSPSSMGMSATALHEPQLSRSTSSGISVVAGTPGRPVPTCQRPPASTRSKPEWQSPSGMAGPCVAPEVVDVLQVSAVLPCCMTT